MLFKLSLKNIKKSIKDYSIYFFTLVIAVAIFYIFNSIGSQQSMLKLTSSKQEMIKALVLILNYVSVFVSVILGFLIVYSNNFLIKRRKKEIGLYQTLGMSKRKVSTILVLETLFVGIISLIVGLFIGVGLSQLISVFTAKLFEADMTSFKFVFSSSALFKTILYFGLIFLLVMIFNVITLSRYKLIDLLNASKKGEKIKVRNKYVTFITFILSIASLGYAYYLLFHDALFTIPSTPMLKMIIFGAVGTFLFFLSLSGFLLKILEKSKKIYLKNLNMFILKQINNRINSTVISTTIICLMLLLTIGILSGSMSLASVFNDNLKENNLTDFTLSSFVSYDSEEENESNIEDILKEEKFDDYVKNYTLFTYYYDTNFTIDNLMTKKSMEQARKEFGTAIVFDYKMPIISETDYNNIMKLFNKKSINIDENEYLILANMEQIIDYYEPALKNNNKIKVNGKVLKPALNNVINTALINSNGNSNDGVLVVSDSIVKNLEVNNKTLIGNYIDTDNLDKLDQDFYEFIMNSEINNFSIMTKIDMEAASVGMKAILTFLGLYLGIVFAISSATVLAIGQLSESSDNKERYGILRQIGADEKMIKKALLIQIAIAFLLPLVIALIHAFFGLKELNSIIKILANINLTSNIILTTLFIVIVYGGYFLATYLASKNIIKENK